MEEDTMHKLGFAALLAIATVISIIDGIPGDGVVMGLIDVMAVAGWLS